MQCALALAEQNIREKTGGPFAALLLEEESGKILEVGVNRVEPLGMSVAHAEIVALTRAQQRLQSFTLNFLITGTRYQLVTSAQMCAMCLGALPWSGITSVLYGATKTQVEEIAGFDEGAIPADWEKELQKRNIQVTGPLLPNESARVLELFVAMRGQIY